MMAPRTPDAATPLRYFWQAIATLVPKMGFPDLASAGQLDEWRNTRLPDWREIFREAVRHDDEHDLSLASPPRKNSSATATPSTSMRRRSG